MALIRCLLHSKGPKAAVASNSTVSWNDRFMWSLSAATRRREDERVADDDDTPAERLGELPTTDGLGDTVLDPGVPHGRVLEHRGLHHARGGDDELDHDPAAEV